MSMLLPTACALVFAVSVAAPAAAGGPSTAAATEPARSLAAGDCVEPKTVTRPDGTVVASTPRICLP